MENGSGDGAEYDETYLESTVGWGGMIVGPDGLGRPMPEVDALLLAIPRWLENPPHLDQAIGIYIDLLQRPESAVRVAAVTAMGEAARRYRQVPHHADAISAVRRLRGDPDVAVRSAAEATLRLLEQLPR